MKQRSETWPLLFLFHRINLNLLYCHLMKHGTLIKLLKKEGVIKYETLIYEVAKLQHIIVT